MSNPTIMLEVTNDGQVLMAAHSSGEPRTFPNREAVKQFMRNHAAYLTFYQPDSFRIVNTVTTEKRWRVNA